MFSFNRRKKENRHFIQNRIMQFRMIKIILIKTIILLTFKTSQESN